MKRQKPTGAGENYYLVGLDCLGDRRPTPYYLRAVNAAGEDTDAAQPATAIDVFAKNQSQAEFAARFGFPLDTLRKWEQGKRHPTGAAKTLLIVIDKSPDAVVAALEAA